MREKEKIRQKEKIKFKNGSTLQIEEKNGCENVDLFSSNGQIQLSIKMQEEGHDIIIHGNSVSIEAKDKFEVNSPVISLNAKKEIRVNSEGNYRQTVKRDVFSISRIQNIEADLGNVNITANDDVVVDGERVKLNCTD